MGHVASWVMGDPLTHDPLTDDYVHQISRTISIAFGSRHVQRDFFYYDKFGDYGRPA